MKKQSAQLIISSSKQTLSKHNEYIESDEILNELCNPHSLNIKQVKESLRYFCDHLALKQIIPAQRNQQLKTITQEPKQYFEYLTEQQIINLVKWQVIVDFFISYTSLLSTLSQTNFRNQTDRKKLSFFSEAYKISLRKLFTTTAQFDEKKGFDIWDIPLDNNNDLNLKNKFKYACFEVFACILDLNLILKFNQCEELYSVDKKHVIQNDTKIFYFVDVGEVLEKGNFWPELEKFFIGENQEKEGQKNEASNRNREIIKLFYLGLTIQTLQFESVSSSLRFTSELLLFIINENNTWYSSSQDNYMSMKAQQKMILTMAAHLSKSLYFLRILKKNNYNLSNLNGQQETQSADVTPFESSNAISRRSIYSKPTTEFNKVDPVQTSDMKMISANKYGTENESNFLNELEYKAEKLIQKISSKYKDLATELQFINQTYQPLSQILTLKHTNTGTELASNYTAKRNKVVKFTEEQKKIFFVFMVEQLKKVYNSIQFDWRSLYDNCKQTFLNLQQNKKIQAQLKNQQNKLIKTQLINQFQQNLQKGHGLIDKTTKTLDLKTNKILGTISRRPSTESQNSKSSSNKAKLTQAKPQAKNIYFPTLKPKLSLQVQNRLKLKQIKQQKYKDQSFFLSQQKLTFQIIQSYAPKQSIPKLQPASTIVSYNKLQQPYKPLLKNLPKHKSTSLPSKIKLNTNYQLKSRFQNIKSYENTRNTIIQRKFSYEMILCKRQNGNSLEKNAFSNQKKDTTSESQLYQNLQTKKKQRSQRSKLKLKQRTKIFNHQDENNKINQSQTYQFKASQRRSKSQEPSQKYNHTQAPQIHPNVIDHLMKASRKRNNMRRESLLLRSSVDKVKKVSKLTEPNDQPAQKSQIPLPLLNSRKSEDIGNLLLQSINVIIENCKKVTKNGTQKTRLKLDSKLSMISKKTSNDQFAIPKIIQQEVSKLDNLKYEDASQILTSMEQYYRTFLQIQKYNQLLENKYEAYVQLDTLSRLMQKKAIFLFKGIVLTVTRKEVLKKKQKERYWNTFRVYFEHDQSILVVEIDEKSVIQDPQTIFSSYLAEKLGSTFSQKKHLLKKENNGKYVQKSFIMIGNLGGNLDIYHVNFIPVYQKHGSESVQHIIKSKKAQKDQTFRFLQEYNHNEHACQMLGLDKKKNTIDCIELYITRDICHSTQTRRVQKFVQHLFFAPMNQYILDWGCNQLQKSQTYQAAQQQQERVRTVFSRQENRVYHIYFLNRSYEIRSRFKSKIKKIDERYPSFSYKQFLEAAYCLSNEQRQFCENVDIIEYACKNLIFNKKYMLFNIKILKAVEKSQKKVFIMIEQKNSSLSDHKMIFFVFPLKVKLKVYTHSSQPSDRLIINEDQKINSISTATVLLEEKNVELMQNYYTNLMYNIQKYHSLANICDFLVANDTIQIKKWPDTMFNKLLLTHPHITIIKKVFLDDQPTNNNHLTTAKNTLQIQRKKSGNLHQDIHEINANNKFHVFATLKIFIFNNHNLIVGVIEISGQSFLFISLFDQLIEKVPRYKCRPLSRNYIDKYRAGTNSTGKQFRSSKKNCSKVDINVKSKKSPFTINKLGSQDSFRMSTKKITKKSIATHKVLKTEKVLMTEEQEMTNIKQRLMGLFKYETELAIDLNLESSKDGGRRSFTIDNHLSKYKMSMKIDGQGIKLMQMKYYWPDIIPQSRRKSLNFRMRDDSLMLIKLNKQGYYLRKSNKVRDSYLETYMRKVAQNKIKFKGNAMNDQLRKQDKLMYYEIYKEFIKEIEKYFYVYNIDQSLLVKIRLGIGDGGRYHVSVVDFDVEAMMESAETSAQDRERLKKIVNFQVKPDHLAMFDIGRLALDRKMLNNKRFRKRINCIVKDQLQSIFRKF